jgi:hypothetical protein
VSTLSVTYTGDSVFEIDLPKFQEFMAGEDWILPAPYDDPKHAEPDDAGHVSTLIDTALAAGAIVAPEGVKLYVLNDDGFESAGLVIGVKPADKEWPIIVDGWGDLSNHVPTSEQVKAHQGDDAWFAHQIIESVLNVANAVLWSAKGGKPRSDDTSAEAPE